MKSGNLILIVLFVVLLAALVVFKDKLPFIGKKSGGGYAGPSGGGYDTSSSGGGSAPSPSPQPKPKPKPAPKPVVVVARITSLMDPSIRPGYIRIVYSDGSEEVVKGNPSGLF